VKEYRLAFLGFGNVGKALASLFLEKREELARRYQITFKVTGVATGRHGMAIDPAGLPIERLGEAEDMSAFSQKPVGDAFAFLRACGADVLFENTPVNYETGQPAVNHLRTALELGMHAITANKGPVVHAYYELTELAGQRDRKFLFESTVMDGAPIFSLFRETLPGANLRSFKGILNSTTNMILTHMEGGESFDQAVAYCQKVGLAETDPSGDIDGWDAVVKVAALATVLMGIPLKPAGVERTGIRGIDEAAIERARREGKRWKLVCTARNENGLVIAKVAPEKVGVDSVFYSINGATSVVQFEMDVLNQLSVVEADPGPKTTAYGLFADFLNAVRAS
jgi:homoserine dehydrogenase